MLASILTTLTTTSYLYFSIVVQLSSNLQIPSSSKRKHEVMLKQLVVGEMAASVDVVAAFESGSNSIIGPPNALFQS